MGAGLRGTQAARPPSTLPPAHSHNSKSTRGWDLAEWLERLTASAEVRNSTEFDPGILWQTGIWRAADEAVWDKVNKKF